MVALGTMTVYLGRTVHFLLSEKLFRESQTTEKIV